MFRKMPTIMPSSKMRHVSRPEENGYFLFDYLYYCVIPTSVLLCTYTSCSTVSAYFSCIFAPVADRQGMQGIQ